MVSIDKSIMHRMKNGRDLVTYRDTVPSVIDYISKEQSWG